MKTREQEQAEKAFNFVSDCRDNSNKTEEYKRFSKSFPALIHSCGLAQAAAFGLAKAPENYINDLAKVIGFNNKEQMCEKVRNDDVALYQKHTIDAISAATWLKRYSEALLKGDD